MPEKDLSHAIVRQALIKDGWRITHDPLHIHIGGVQMFIDLGAEKIIAAEKAGRQIAVEIKSFNQLSPISEFHAALGQFFNYRLALEEQSPTRILFLAVPLDVYRGFFRLPFIEMVRRRSGLKLLVYDVVREAVALWEE